MAMINYGKMVLMVKVRLFGASDHGIRSRLK